MTDKIKILQFPIAASYGGITRYAINNWKCLDKNRFQCDFATMSKSLDFAGELQKMGSKIFYISCYAEQDKKRFASEFNAILDNGYDICHLHTALWKSTIAEDVCRARGIKKIIVHAHNTGCDVPDGTVRAALIQAHCAIRATLDENLASDYWACSREAADWLFGGMIPKSSIKIMNNAIEVDRFLFNAPVRERLRSELGLDEKIVVGTVGRLCYQKNQSFLIKAFARVCQFRSDLFLVIVGEGGLRAELEYMAMQCEVRDKVLFMGMRDDVQCLYQMIDLFVLPSNFEGNPIVAIEAQAAGLKCILADTITKEADVTGNVEYLPLKVDAWARALACVRSYNRKNMKQIVALAGFDISEQIKVIEKEYADVGNELRT